MEAQLILDRYRPLAELGEGGHASVTLAYDTRMGRRVAIKRLPLRSHEALPARRAGLAEARTAALLNHPDIVTVYEWDADEEAGEAYLVMEYVEGVSLSEVLHRLARLDLDETAAVVASVGAALAYGHANGVLHLDIKPENVLVTRDGDVKVADFGIAALTGADGTARIDEGTLGYMPPEQLRGEPLDARTDVWALASLTYEALTGTNPYVAGTMATALAAATADDAPDPSSLVRGLPRSVDDVLFAALAPKPAERYQDAAAFTDALLPSLGDPDVGREALAAVVDELTDDDVAEEEAALRRLGVWDRYGWLSPWVTRAAAGVVCLFVAHAGFAPLGLGTAATWGASALVALAGAGAPALGVALAIAALDLGAWRTAWPWGLAGLVLGAGYWWAVARRGSAAGFVPFAAPLAGVLRAAPAVPMLAGFTFEPLPAALASAASCVTVMLMSAASGSGAPLLVVQPPVLLDPLRILAESGRILAAFGGFGALIAVLGWAGAGAAMSLLCRRGTRLGAVLGLAASSAIILGAYWAWSLTTAGFHWPSSVVLQQTTVSLILSGVVVVLGAPVRGEGDDE